MQSLCVPKGIYLRLGTYTDGLYNLLVWGWTDPGEGVVIHTIDCGILKHHDGRWLDVEWDTTANVNGVLPRT